MIVFWAYSLVKASGMSISIRTPSVSITCSVILFPANDTIVGIDNNTAIHQNTVNIISLMRIAILEELIEKLQISIELIHRETFRGIHP